MKTIYISHLDMNKKLEKLADLLASIDVEAANTIYKLAGRHDKVIIKSPIKLQPAYKYIMYLKLMHGFNDAIFHRMKRKYLDTSRDLQEECFEELNKIILRDALTQKIPSSTIRIDFMKRLSDFELDKALWNSYFKRGIGKRSS
jgi:hypothetical protein